MGLFDIFSSRAGKLMAINNNMQLQRGQNQSLGAIQNALNQGLPAITEGRDLGISAINAGRNAGLGYLQGGSTLAEGAITGAQPMALDALRRAYGGTVGEYMHASDMYAPYAMAGTGALGTLRGGLGIDSPGNNAAARAAFESAPGRRYAIDEATRAVERGAAARGGLLGGNTLAGVVDRASNVADQQYGSWLDRLAHLANTGYNATAAQAALRKGAGDLYTGLGAATAGRYTDDAARLAEIYGTTGGAAASLASGAGTAGANLYGQTGSNIANLVGQAGNNQANIYNQTAQGMANQGNLAAQSSANAASNQWSAIGGILGLGANLLAAPMAGGNSGGSVFGNLFRR